MEIGITQSIQTKKEDELKWKCIVYFVTNPEELSSSISVKYSLKPGENKTVKFVLAWHSPKWLGGGYLSCQPGDPATKQDPVIRWPQEELIYKEYAKKPQGNYFTHMYDKYYTSAKMTADLLADQHEELLKRVLSWQQAVYTYDKLPVWLRDSLVNNLYLIAEDSMWAQAENPLPAWVRFKDGLFGMNEDPRSCPQIECHCCSFYGNWPLVHFFPELALSTLRGYKGYMFSEGEVP